MSEPQHLSCFKCDDGNTPLYCLNCANEELRSQLAPWLQCATDEQATFTNLMRGTIALGPDLALKYAAAKGWQPPEESAAVDKRVKELEGMNDHLTRLVPTTAQAMVYQSLLQKYEAAIERERVLREAVTRISELKDFISGGHARNIAKEALAATGDNSPNDPKPQSGQAPSETEVLELSNKQHAEYRLAFWQHMAQEHDLHLLEGEQDEIERLILGPRNGEREWLMAELNRLYRQNYDLKDALAATGKEGEK